MREFFIDALEAIIAVVLILGAIVILISGIGAMFGAQGGFLRGLAILIGGSIYLMLIGGMAYLGLGIYHNTRRTAEAVERLADHR